MYGIYLKQDPTVGNSRVVYNPKDEKKELEEENKTNKNNVVRRLWIRFALRDAGEIRYWQDGDFM